jgi:hypothetical protein
MPATPKGTSSRFANAGWETSAGDCPVIPHDGTNIPVADGSKDEGRKVVSSQ